MEIPNKSYGMTEDQIQHVVDAVTVNLKGLLAEMAAAGIARPQPQLIAAEGQALELRSRDRLMEFSEVQQYLGIDQDTLYTWVKAGKIPAQRVGSRIKFDPRKFARWLEQNSTGS
jgi:excisionase family DNA binding protein